MKIKDLKGTYQYAMHGLGVYKGLRQTNTFDAFEYWYGKGIRVFEIDLAKTADDSYVAVAHAMDKWSLNRLELFNLPEEDERTKSWFMGQRLFSISTKGLKPLSLDSMVELLQQYENSIIMMDLYGMFSKRETQCFTRTIQKVIGEKTDLWDRILLEAYNMEMVDGIKAVSSSANIIYCVRYENNLHDEKTVSSQELIENKVGFVSYPWRCSSVHPGEIEEFSKYGLTVFSRTKFNTKDKQLKNMGVSVNIIAKRFDGPLILLQWPLYMVTYIKRIIIKVEIKLKSKVN